MWTRHLQVSSYFRHSCGCTDPCFLPFRLRAKYVNVAVDKQHHFECLSSPLNLNDFQSFAEEEKVYSDSLQMIFKPNVIMQIGAEVGSNKLANTLFNRRKTTVFAFGETFAN